MSDTKGKFDFLDSMTQDERADLHIEILQEMGKRADRRIADLEHQLSARDAEIARLREALRLDQPYPVTSVLTKLADAADHLLNDHSCDSHGYELVGSARDHAREIVAALEPKP
jgi:hypothetical protein